MREYMYALMVCVMVAMCGVRMVHDRGYEYEQEVSYV